MANLLSIFLTLFLFSLSKFSSPSSATTVANDQTSCSMCSGCDNPCQLPPPPPVVDCPPPPSPPPPPPPVPTSECPPPPAPPSCDSCVYPSPPPPSSVIPYPPADGGQFPGVAPPPPNPILPYYPYYYYSPPSASGKSVSFSWEVWPLAFFIILCL